MISVIVAVYNVEEYIKDCITSILLQSFSDFELILVNDGSTDSSGDICNKYAQMDNRVRVINQKNSGAGIARNKGIESSCGEYLMFVDGDDSIDTQMIEMLYNNLIDNDADISICNHKKTYPDRYIENSKISNKTIVYTGSEGVEKIVDKRDMNMICPIGKLYKAQLFDGIRFPNVRYHEDEFVIYKILYNAKKIVETSDKLYNYLQRLGSAINSPYNAEKLVRLNALYETIIFMQTNNEEKLTRQAIYRYMLTIQISFYKVKNEMDDTADLLATLIDRYKGEYFKFRLQIRELSIHRRLILRLFYYIPSAYIFVIFIVHNILSIFKRGAK